MRKQVMAAMVCAIASSGAWANVVTYNVRATSATTVAPGGTVDYELIATVDSGDNAGLALFQTFLLTNFGVGQVAAGGFGTAVDAAFPLFGNLGQPNSDDIRFIGAAQNLTNYVTGIGQGEAAVLVFGTLTVPNTVGVYSVDVGDDPAGGDVSIANVVTPDGTGAFAGVVEFGSGFDVTVQVPDDPGGDDPGGDDPGGDDPGGDDPGGDDPGGDDPGNVNGGGDNNNGDNNNDDNNNNNNNDDDRRGPCGTGIATATGASFLMLAVARIGRRRERPVG